MGWRRSFSKRDNARVELTRSLVRLRWGLKNEWAGKPGSVVGTIIYLERMLPCVSSTQPERTEGQPYRVPICACSRWGLPSRAVADALVRSYRTVSAFPRCRALKRVFARSLLFCGTDPSGRPAQPLAGILPFGARTFLTLGARSSGPLRYGILPNHRPIEGRIT